MLQADSRDEVMDLEEEEEDMFVYHNDCKYSELDSSGSVKKLT